MHKLYENWNQFLMSEVNLGETPDEHEYRKKLWNIKNALTTIINQNFNGIKADSPLYKKIVEDISDMLQQDLDFADDLMGFDNEPSDEYNDYVDVEPEDEDLEPLFEKRRKVSKKK